MPAKVVEAPRRMLLSPAEVLLNYGLAKDALPFARKMVKESPQDWKALNLYGLALLNLGRHEEALDVIGQAYRKKGSVRYVTASNLGIAHEYMGEFREALKLYREAFDIKVDVPAIIGNYSSSLLRFGKWDLGWKLWEFGCRGTSWFPPPGIPPWDGQSLKGKRLLVLKDGGYGDTFLYMRFLKEVRERGAHVSLLVWDKQIPAIEGNPWIDRLIPSSKGINGMKFDYSCAVMSLPWIVKAQADEIPWEGPYITATKEKVELFRKVTANGHQLRVGICWAAEEVGYHRIIRSLSLPDIEPFGKIPVRWFSLAPGRQAPSWATDKTKLLADWADTAGMIANMDLVITVDTAIAHLAGAMGKPVWIMLPMNTDWKWGSRTEPHKWYPSQRLFYQDHPTKWAGCVREVSAALREEVAR